MSRDLLDFLKLMACALAGLGLGVAVLFAAGMLIGLFTRLDHCTDPFKFHGLSFLLTLGVVLLVLVFTRRLVLVRVLLGAAVLGALLAVPVLIYATPFLC